MKQQMYSTPKYHITADIEANSREDAIAQLAKLINESPYEHKIKIGVWLLCAGETYPENDPNAPSPLSLSEQSELQPLHDHKKSSQKSYPLSSDNLPANHNEGTLHHE